MRVRYLIAAILILIGIGLFFDQLHYWAFGNIIGTWWPLIIIAAGLSHLSQSKNSLFSGIIIVIVGVLLQANELDMLPGGFWATFWPIMLIFIGIWIITGRKGHFQMFASSVKETSEDMLHINTVFSGVKQRFVSENFQGGMINVMFGGATLDLTNCRLAPGDNILDLSVAFGGVELFIPKDWIIESKGSPFLGGFDNKTWQNNIDLINNSKLIIKYSVAFGGIELKN